MKKNVLVNTTIEIELPYIPGWIINNAEARAKYLEEWCKEFEAFVRDHRSQDPVSLSVIREYEDQCTHCGLLWEEDEDGPICCSKAQSEFHAERDRG